MSGEQSGLKESAPFRGAQHTVPTSLCHSKMPLFGYCLHTFLVSMYLSHHSWIVSIVCGKLWIGDDEVEVSWKGAEFNLQKSPSLIKGLLTIWKLTSVSVVKIHVAWKKALLDCPFKHIFRLEAFTPVTNILIFKKKLLTFKTLESAAAWPVGGIWLFTFTEVQVRAGSLESGQWTELKGGWWKHSIASSRITQDSLQKADMRYHLHDISLYSRVETWNLISLLLLPYFWDNTHTICDLKKFSLFSSVPVPLVLSLQN